MRKKTIHTEIKFILGLMAICFILYGCATPIHVQRGLLNFQNKPEKLPLKAGLYLDDKERNYDIPALFGGKFMIGEALELAAAESLGIVFPTISLFNEKGKVTSDIERIIAIKFGPKTSASSSLEPGLSKHEVKREAKTELFCEVYDKEWNLLWKETVIGNATLEYRKSAWGGMGGALGGYAAGLQNEREMSDIITRSLVSALEQLNDKILTSEKDAIGIAPPAATAPKPAIAIAKPAEIEKKITNSIGMTFVYIKPGIFMMGSPTGEPGRSDSFETQHQVTLTRGFYMQTTEVTQGQWRAVMGNNPSHFSNCGDNCPVENVLRFDVKEFIRRLNQMEGSSSYRLPTEAEWEFACRADTNTRFSFGDSDSQLSDYAWYESTSFDKTHPVAQKQPNNWGLYDMHGNVAEWCQDWFGGYPLGNVTDPAGPLSGSDFVVRGGVYRGGARFCRSAYRTGLSPALRYFFLGFRLSRSPYKCPIIQH